MLNVYDLNLYFYRENQIKEVTALGELGKQQDIKKIVVDYQG